MTVSLANTFSTQFYKKCAFLGSLFCFVFPIRHPIDNSETGDIDSTIICRDEEETRWQEVKAYSEKQT